MGSTFSKLQEMPQRLLKAFPLLFFTGQEHPTLMANCLLQGEAYCGTHDGAPISSEVTDTHQVGSLEAEAKQANPTFLSFLEILLPPSVGTADLGHLQD